MALGHFDAEYEDRLFVGLLERGILWSARRECAIEKARKCC